MKFSPCEAARERALDGAGGSVVEGPSERLILVDEADTPVGTEEKARAHLTGALHRAFSVFVFNTAGDVLLQRRAATKYHSGGLWSNTCCSHPHPGEDTAEAAHRRLRQEMGFETPLHRAFSFLYRADVGGGLIEHELDHVFLGTFDGRPVPDPREVDGYRWVCPRRLRGALRREPQHFTIWLGIAWGELSRRDLLPGAGRGGRVLADPRGHSR